MRRLPLIDIFPSNTHSPAKATLGSESTMIAARPSGTLAPEDVPQANRPERIIDVLVQLSDRAPLPSDASALRDHRHYCHAAQLLDFLTDARELTPSAHALLTLPHTARFARLAIAFGESTCGRAWAKWAGVGGLVDTAPDSAEKFLAEASALSDATIKRRAGALRSWHLELLPHHPTRRSLSPDSPNAQQPPSTASNVFSRSESARLLQALAAATKLLRVATAYLTVYGYEILARRLSTL